MACTGNCTGLGNSETENMVWGPDNFYVATLDDVEICLLYTSIRTAFNSTYLAVTGLK